MCRKLTLLISFVFVLGLVHSVSAIDTYWTDAGGGDSWCTPENWDPCVPGPLDRAIISPPPYRGPIIDCDVHVYRVLGPGWDSDNDQVMDITGGTIVVDDIWRWGGRGTATLNISGSPNITILRGGGRSWRGADDGTSILNISGSPTISVAGSLRGADECGSFFQVNMSGGHVSAGAVTFGDDGVGELNMGGGTIDVTGDMHLGGTRGSAGTTVNMTGGSITVGGTLWAPPGTGTIACPGQVLINLDAGTIECGSFAHAYDDWHLDIEQGVLIIAGDVTADIAADITAGYITAYGGSGVVQYDYDDRNPGKTTVTAAPMIFEWCLAYDTPEKWVLTLAAYNGNLYAGTRDAGRIYAFDGASWQVAFEPAESGFFSLGVYSDRLYAGTMYTGRIYTYDGHNWQMSFDSGQGHIQDLIVYDTKLYAAAGHDGGGYHGAKILVYDGTTWQQSWYPGTVREFTRFAIYNNKLYVGAYTGANDGGDVYVFDGTSWNLAFDSPDRWAYLVTYRDKLYLGTCCQGLFYSFDGTTWKLETDFTEEAIGYAFTVHNDLLYAGTVSGWAPGEGRIYVWNGTDWELSYDSPEINILSLGLYNNRVYAGTGDNGLIYATGGPPVADAGGPYVALASSWDGAYVQLDGTGSHDLCGVPLAHQWDLDLLSDSDGDCNPANDVDDTTDRPNRFFPIGQTCISLVVVNEDGQSSQPDVTTVTVSVINVGIDIKPGSYPNAINMGSQGVVPVAFLTDGGFDASTVDPATVTLRGEDFADGLVKLRGKKDAAVPMANLEDVDGDGDLDLIVHLETEKLAEYELEEICEIGALTYDGYVVSGSDTIQVVPQ